MTLKEAYSYSVQFLERNGADEADFKALCVCCHLAGIRNSEYLQHTQDDIIISRLAKMLWRLKEGEPLQYVLGKWDFYESEFYVGPGVLIPRPETEELVELAIRSAENMQNPVIFDLCAGSGCIGVSLAKKIKGSTVYCVEKSADAFSYLEKNAKNVPNVHCVCADIFTPTELPEADIIISNPPYIKSDALPSLQSEVRYEPSMALDGGADGLDFYRCINERWATFLKPHGILLLEIGNEQGSEIPSVLSNFAHIDIIKDIYGNDRMVKAILK